MAGSNLKGVVQFEANGQAYTLQFTIDAIVMLEDLLDKSIGQIGAQMATGRVGTVRAAIWAGLQAHHPGLTIKQAGDVVLSIKGATAMDLVTKALKIAFGADEEEPASDGQARPPVAEEAGTGQPSSPPGAN